MQSNAQCDILETPAKRANFFTDQIITYIILRITIMLFPWEKGAEN